MREQLSMASQKFNSEISELQSAIIRAKPACQGLGLDAAKQMIEELQKELEEFDRAVEAGKLKPLPGDSLEKGARQLTESSKLVNQGVAQLLSAAAQGNEIYTSQAARDTSHRLKNLTGAVRSVAATADNYDTQKKLINSGHEVLALSTKLVRL